MTLKVALVGCGKTADMHVSGIRRFAGAQLVAVCDVEPLMADQLANRFHVKNRYSDFESLLSREAPDVVHIATPPQSHLPLALKALGAGAHLVIEKPLGLDFLETRRILDEAAARSRKVTVAYTYYFDSAARILRELVRDGTMGEAVHLESFLGYDLKGPFGTPVMNDPEHWVHGLPGKLFRNVLDHLLNKVTEYMADEKPTIQTYSWRAGGTGWDGDGGSSEFPDEARVVMIGEKQSAYLTFSSNSRPVRHSFVFHGTRNSARLDFDSSTIMLSRPPALPGVLGRLAAPFREGWQHIRGGGRNVIRFMGSDYQYFSGFHYLLQSFYESIVNDSPVPIPYSEILRNASYADRIVEQMSSETVLRR